MQQLPLTDHNAEPEVLEIGYKRGSTSVRQSVLLCLLALAAAAFAGSQALRNGLGNPLWAVGFLTSGVLTVLIVPLTVRAIWRMARGRPLLTLDGDGVTLHSARVTLPWSNISEIRITHTAQKGQTISTIVFVPVDAERATAGLHGLRRRFAADGIRRVGGPIFARVHDLALPLDDIIAGTRRLTAAPVRHQHHLDAGS